MIVLLRRKRENYITRTAVDGDWNDETDRASLAMQHWS